MNLWLRVAMAPYGLICGMVRATDSKSRYRTLFRQIKHKGQKSVCFWFLGWQFSVTQIPHLYPQHLLPLRCKHLESMQNFVGIIEYMCSWRWAEEGIVTAAGGNVFTVAALPLRIDNSGAVEPLGAYLGKGAVFPSDRHAFEYLKSLAGRDLQYRGMRDD